ncbi:helix-turn-helix transcriptional regulator [Scandinavium sp. NPDC088450]|uniref:helix-turn-helix transcriptional regulator n=1 Tax=Scandinavium sp. NPDC088450 TaxID=3364514 RepID=UPI00384F4862
MVNIIIKDEDEIFRLGMEELIREFFATENIQVVNFIYELTEETVAAADIIVVSLCLGEADLCLPELKARGTNVVIGIVDEYPLRKGVVSSCTRTLTFIERNERLNAVREKIAFSWQQFRPVVENKIESNCYTCRHKQLSLRQGQIMALYYQGRTVNQIASELNISDKTFFSHKYLVMNKYNLHSEQELLIFLHRLKEKNTVYNRFRECLNLLKGGHNL